MTRLMQAAKRKGLDHTLIERVGEAFNGFDAFVKEHARDRATLDALATGLSPDDGESAAADLRWRRSAVRDNSHIWGIQARTTLLCGIYHAGAHSSKVDAVLIPGMVGLHALRRNVPFRLMGNAGAYDASDPEASQKPLKTPGVERVLTEFSSRPLPRIETARGFNGMQETSLRFDGIGKAAAVDIFTVLRMEDAYSGKPQPWFGNTRGIAVPSEALVLDVIVPKGWTNPSTVRTSTHGNVSMYESVVPRIPEFVMPVKEEAVYLGNDLRSIETTDVPRYPEMVRGVLTELGWHTTTFDIYRTRVRFPIMHSLVHMHADAVKP